MHMNRRQTQSDKTGSQRTNFTTAKNYKWKFGFSLIDLGGITFSNSASAYNYKNVDTSWDKITRVNPKTLAQVDQLMYDKFNGANNASVTNRFFVWAPSAASIQYDYNFNDLIYANFSVVQRVVINTEARLARMNTLAFTPRYERSDLEIALPFILNEYLYPNLGLMVRYKFFFIGSDQLGSTLGLTAGVWRRRILRVKSTFLQRRRFTARYLKAN